MQTNEIFLLVGEVMAQIASAFFKCASSAHNGQDKMSSNGARVAITAAIAPFTDFVQEPWWDIVDRVDEDAPAPREECCGENDSPVAFNTVKSSSAAHVPLADTLRSLCEDSSALLRKAFALTLGSLPAPLEQALSAERFGRVVGMFEQNNVGVRAPSPIPEVVRELLECRKAGASRDVVEEVSGLVGQIIEQEEKCDDDDEEQEECHDAVCSESCNGQRESESCRNEGQDGCGGTSCSGSRVNSAEDQAVLETDNAVAILRSAVSGDHDGYGDDEGEGLFAPLDGTALYSLICCMNHSCRPNCLVRYPGRRRGTTKGSDLGSVAIAKSEPLVAEVVLLKDVPAGEELTQSYVTKEMGLSQRRRALEDYGFFCTCPRCTEEASALSS